MESKTEYEAVTISCAEVTAYLESHNWQEFQNEGHFISATMPRHSECPACRNRATVHFQDQLEEYHAGDRIWCLSLYTPGCAPDSPKGTGLQILRVQAATREEVIEKMRTAMLDSIYAHGRQAYTMHLDWVSYHDLKAKMDALTTFVTRNIHIPLDGLTPYELAGRILREYFLTRFGTSGRRLSALPTDEDPLLPLSWRRGAAAILNIPTIGDKEQ